MATVQIKRIGAVQVAGQRMKPAGQLLGSTEIVDCGKVIEAATKLPGRRLTQCARGEGFVMAQLPESFRLEKDIHPELISQ